ncbi:group 1 glycosyl transferase [Novosphingobium sp. MBES04]|nr:group 1 glycosyl transferase [Novosphingobium sp. MBES04]
MHDDRVEAVADLYRGQADVVGIEMYGRSDTYAWDNADANVFRKITLFPQEDYSRNSTVKTMRKLIAACLETGARDIFLCNYERPAVFMTAMALAARGRRVYAMSCSKFDDIERRISKEFAKRLFFLPYKGAISSGTRARDYMRLMGVPRDRIAMEYNTLSIERIRKLAGREPAPGGVPKAERHFTIVARFVEKKNLFMALEAFARFCAASSGTRKLNLCGSGELEAKLRARVEELGLGDRVVFHGFLQSDGVARVLGESLALLLPSVEEQFGNVVIEAQALGLPVILSDNCGARDKLVRSGVNGFVIEPDNPEGLAFFMGLLDRDDELWERMSLAAVQSAPKGDVARFAEAVRELVQ